MIARDTLEAWMRSVLEKGWQGVAEGQNPFAAAIYFPDGTQISIAHNTVAKTNCPTRHAETNAIDEACQAIGNDCLNESWLLATGEPCPMCAAAASLAQIPNIAFGSSHQTIRKAGFQTADVSLKKFAKVASYQLNIVAGVCEPECDEFLMRNPCRE